MTSSCLYYHKLTSYRRHGISPHFLDWENQPEVFKRYYGVEPIGLPRKVHVGDITLSRILKDRPEEADCTELTLATLSSILLLTCTITARAMHSGAPFYFRSVASAGALYPSELYLFSEGIRDLDRGLYHFSVDRHGLHPLRQAIDTVKSPFLNFFLSSIFFRSSWKYRDRAYRYCLLDTGHLLENLMLSLMAHGFLPRITYDFEDSLINSFLGLDTAKEVCLGVCCTGNQSSPCPALPAREKWGPLPHKVRQASVVSAHEVSYDAIIAMHEASSSVRAMARQEIKMDALLGIAAKTEIQIPELKAWPDELPYVEAVFSRRSSRNFVPHTMAQPQFQSILDGLCSDSMPFTNPWPLSTGLLVANIEGYESGFYLLDRTTRKLALIKKGDFTREMAHICLDQAWLGNASCHFLFLSNLEALEDVFGPRGYRHAMLEAGRTGQLLYLIATSLGLGCCGIGAFYDQGAADLLGLNENSRLLYLVALGPVKRLKGH